MPEVTTGASRSLGQVMQEIRQLEVKVWAARYRLGQCLHEVQSRRLAGPSPEQFWAWFAGLDLPVKRREAERLITVASPAGLSVQTAMSIGQYRSYQVCSYAEATRLKAEDLVRRNAVIEGVPLSQHTKLSLQGAIARAILKRHREDSGYAPPPAPGSEASVLLEGRQHVKRYRSWATREGVHVDVDLRLIDGVAYAVIRVPANELDLLMEDDD